MSQGKHIKPIIKKHNRKVHKGRSRARHLSRAERERLRNRRLMGAVLAAALFVGVPVCACNQRDTPAMDKPVSEISSSRVSYAAPDPLASLTTHPGTYMIEPLGIIEPVVLPEPVALAELEELEPPLEEQLRELCWDGELLTSSRLPPEVQEIVTPFAEDSELMEQLAVIVTNEIGGLQPEDAHSTREAEWAAVVWCILNRADNSVGKENVAPDIVMQIATTPNAFASKYYKAPFEGTHEIAEDVLCRWACEFFLSEEDSGRTLPSTYKFFNGYKGHNRFREEYRSEGRWGWSWPDPYAVD